MRAHFIKALAELNNRLAELAAEAERAVCASAAAVENGSASAAAQIVQHDAEIDETENAIEEECLKILALYQPVASDLRQVVTILKVNNELERIGDLAVNIAARVPDMALYHDREIEKPDFHDMVYRACDMLKRSLDALAYHDAKAAEAVIGADDAVDTLHRENYTLVRELILKHPDEACYYLDVLTVSRCLERIADIATNIAEDVIYLESGRIVRHRIGELFGAAAGGGENRNAGGE